MTRSPITPRHDERGMSWVSVLLFLALVLGGYLGWVWVPVYWDHIDVKQSTRDFMNRAVKDRDDAALVAGLSKRLASIRRVRWVDEGGQAWEAPAVDVPVESISWERDVESKPPMLRVSFSYERVVTFPFIGKTQTKHFDITLENDLTVPEWDTK